MGEGSNKIWPVYRFIVVLAVGIFYTSFFPQQNDFTQILLGYSLAFGAYTFLIINIEFEIKHLIWIAVGLAVIPVFSFPNLSNDIYRFLWDGAASLNGINPYAFSPHELVEQGRPLGDPRLYELMNSRDYHSVYPAVCQVLYIVSFKLGGSIEGQTLILKVLYFLIHILGLYWLSNLVKDQKNANRSFLIYALNPLVIVEGIGNLHAEIIMVSFVFGFIYYYRENQLKGALTLSLAVATKLLPAVIIPYLFFNRSKMIERKLLYYSLTFLVILFIPMLIGLNVVGFGSGLNLYFQKFEFNGGLYYALRYIGKLLSGYNLILYLGPILALIAGVLILIKSRKIEASSQNALNLIFASLGTYFLVATTIHPWYIIGLVGFGVVTKYRFQLLWSYLIIFTYINYSYDVYNENMLVVFVEYAVLFYLIYREKFVEEYKVV